MVNANGDLRKAKGGVIGRNESFAPWTNSFDVRLSQEVPGFFKGNKGIFTFDILNVGNMINRKWGRINEVAFQSAGGQVRSFVDYVGMENGKYVLQHPSCRGKPGNASSQRRIAMGAASNGQVRILISSLPRSSAK